MAGAPSKTSYGDASMISGERIKDEQIPIFSWRLELSRLGGKHF
jgi:hypothetical protein